MTPETYLKTKDSVLGRVIDRFPLPPVKSRPRQNYFRSLAVEIINQQLSGRVADVIEARFKALFKPARFPKPDDILRTPDSKLRATGMSYAKVAYIKDLAEAVKEKRIDFQNLHTFSDEDVIAELIEIKGIGRWTAEMFLMFALGRPDVFSYGDLAIRKAMQKLYRLRTSPSPLKAAEISARWKPYRTLASRYLWASLEA